MIKFCPYCSALHKAIAHQNYCSNMGDTISNVSTNAYYFKANKLYSGDHVSRLSIRTISDGYQYHQVNKQDLILKKDNYLIVNEGEEFHSEISVEKDIEGILVAFSNSDVQSLFTSLRNKEQKLLDDPFELDQVDIPLESQSVNLSNQLKLLMVQIKHGILTELECNIYFEEIFMKILVKVFEDQSELQSSIAQLAYKKDSTKKEIYRRVRKAKDFIDGHLKDNLSVKELSQEATMSPFHFIRSFKKIYRVSPHQYLTAQRLQKAKFLLRDTDNTVGDICQQVGLMNSSSFTRLFKRKEGKTPYQYRMAHA